MNPVRLITLASTLLLAFPSVHYAATHANSLTASLGAGPEFIDAKRKMENVTAPYLALGYQFTPQWGIEALWATFKTKFDRRDIADNKQVSGTLVMLDGVYHFNAYHFVQPFITAGVGITGLNPNRFDAHNEGNINAGVGVQFFANDTVAFRLDARDIYTMVGGKNDFYLTGGVSFFLDLC